MKRDNFESLFEGLAVPVEWKIRKRGVRSVWEWEG